MVCSIFFAIIMMAVLAIALACYSCFNMTFLASLAIAFLIGFILLLLFGPFYRVSGDEDVGLCEDIGLFTLIGFVVFGLFITLYAPYVKRGDNNGIVFSEQI